MTPLMITALSAALLATFAVIVREKPLFLAAVAGGEDADMKIAPESFSHTAKSEDNAEVEARDYLLQKNAGNISLARALGEQYAALLMQEAKTNFDPWPEGMAESLLAHHRLLLFSFVVNRVVAELSPNSILAHTTLNVFYNEIEEKAPQLDANIRDMASYSLYILCERSEGCTKDQVGKIFARLCADKDNERLIAQGQQYYHAYYDACSRLHRETKYVQV